VIAVDANILLYAFFPHYPQHVRAREWLDKQLNGSAQVGLPWICTYAFIRIGSNPRAFDSPQPTSVLWRQVHAWLSLPNVWVPLETARHLDVMGELLRSPSVNGNLVTDAHLAALAIEHGLTVCSADTDFARFTNVRWFNPLA
jgi:uncharacterized protein